MAAGFFPKSLSSLLSSAARWVEFADGTSAPTHGAIQIDPATGLPLDISEPTVVSEADSLIVSGSVQASAVIFTQDMTGYESVSVQITSLGSGTVNYEVSNDNANWTAISGLTAASSNSSTPASSDTSNGSLRQFRRMAKYFRVRTSSYTTGTVTVVAEFTRAPVNGPIGIIPAIGSVTDAAWDLSSGSPSVISLLKKIALNTAP